MSRKRYTPEQIIHLLREAEVLISQGMTAADTARQIGVVEQTYYRWHVVRCWGSPRPDVRVGTFPSPASCPASSGTFGGAGF